MKIYKIVLTGGPSAGKTTIFNSITKKLREYGFTVLTVPETAREIFQNGIERQDNEDFKLNLQNSIMKLQKLKETIQENFAKQMMKDNVIILYDRAIIDNNAYLDNDAQFKQMLTNNNLTEINAIDKYDLVIDLISLATINSNKYVNDETRQESVEEAKILDEKITYSWLIHKNLKIVLPTEKIEDKEKIVLWHIINLINHKNHNIITTRNIEQNQLIELEELFNQKRSKTITVTDFYLKTITNMVYKLIHREYDNNHSYLIEKYTETNNIIYNYQSEVLNVNLFNKYLKQYEIEHIETRKETIFIDNFKINRLCLKEDKKELLIQYNKESIPNNLGKQKKYDKI